MTPLTMIVAFFTAHLDELRRDRDKDGERGDIVQTVIIVAAFAAAAIAISAILILKASSLVSVVGIADLTRTAQNIASSNYRPIETFAAAGALYLVLNIAVGGAGEGLGRLLGRGR